MLKNSRFDYPLKFRLLLKLNQLHLDIILVKSEV